MAQHGQTLETSVKNVAFNQMVEALEPKFEIMEEADKEKFAAFRETGGSKNFNDNIKGLQELHRKYVDSDVFPEPKKAEVDASSLGLEGDAVKMFECLKDRFDIGDDSKLKIWAKIFTVGSKLMDHFVGTGVKVFTSDCRQYTSEQLEGAYKIIEGNPDFTYEEFKQKCDKEILNGRN